ncbi:GNAT family N-acetyltransferase [Streptomyces sp. SP18CS02]|uniref:GNAT family N-acetyltransferase n=1 Tax=Streptomyces sp. SP18CS02 TaxID=3002531 RepID=UPI002E7877E7|nr:GNAT family N-acetyltransferase [Streptomyces sp. SP18CS02]MEE1754066.1 GNAT family N-acetyltransferase [Streptomyces sp. SP18CS02]
MEHDALLALFDREGRRDARPDGPGMRIERDGDVVRQTGPAHGWNGILWSDLDPARADAAIDRQVRHFTSLGLAFEWKLYAHDRPGDLAGRLRAAGFRPEPEESLMVAGADDIAALPAAPPEGIELRPVTDAAGAALVAAVHDQAFGTDGTHIERQLLDRLAAHPDTVAAVVAMAGDRPVGSARLEMPPGTRFAGLWGGGTVEDWRGRGLYRSLLAHRARIAAARGYRHLQVDASAMSGPVLRRLGFARLTTTTPYVHEP